MIKLLIVDDEMFTREGVANDIAWKHLGINFVETAQDGYHALEVTQVFHPDILLTDVRMPAMDGIELAFKVQEILPSCKIVFMSAFSDKEYLKSAIKLKAIRYVEKPLDLDEVRNAVSEAARLCLEEKRKLQNEKEMDQRYQNSITEIRAAVALELRNRHNNSDYIIQRVNDANLTTLHHHKFTTILFRFFPVNGSSSDLGSIIRNRLYADMDCRLSEYGLQGISAVKDNEYIVIHLYCPTEHSHFLKRSNLHEFCSGMLEDMKGSLQAFVSIGQAVNHYLQIYESYQTAVVSMQKCFYRGYQSIIFPQDNSQSNYQVSEEVLMRFSKSIFDEDEAQVMFLIRTISSDIRRHDGTLVNYAKDVFYQLLSSMYKASESRKINLAADHCSDRFLWESLYKFNTLQEIEQFCLEKATTYFDSLRSLKSQSDAVTNIIKYIEKNFHDENLSIKDLSDFSGLSSSYISILFKERTGKTVNTYLTEYRIEKAREYLKDARLKVLSVASRVGYADSNYFAKIFRKATGLTPSEYKERYLK